MFEKFNNTSFIQERCAQNSEYIKRCSAEFEFTFYNGNQTVCNDGSIDLYSNSILRSAPKGFDVKMLLDPFKEEFNLPPFFIKQSYLRGFYLKVVRQVYKGSPMLMTIKAYTTKLSRIFLFSQWTGQSDYLIKKNIVRSVKKFISLDDLVLKLSSLPNNKFDLMILM